MSTAAQIRERRRHVIDRHVAWYFEAQEMDCMALGVVICAYRYKGSGMCTMTRRPDYSLEDAQVTAAWLNELVAQRRGA